MLEETQVSIVTRIGLDLAKDVFQVHAVNAQDEKVTNKQLKRKDLLQWFAKLERSDDCLVAMEACGSSHHWRRELEKLGYRTMAIPPAYVKPYVRTNKNDANDARAICEAASRPGMPTVRLKTVAEQDAMMLIKQRDGLVRERTRQVNRIRGQLSEYGIFIGQGINTLRRKLPEILEDADNGLETLGRSLVQLSYDYIVGIDAQIELYENKIKELARSSAQAQRLQTAPGIGPITAMTLIAQLGDMKQFAHARSASEYLGVVPRQFSSGGKTVLGGISKRGNSQLRSLLIHGARSVIRVARNKDDKLSRWAVSLAERRGNNVAAVAVANKLLRIVWAMQTKEQEYRVMAA